MRSRVTLGIGLLVLVAAAAVLAGSAAAAKPRHGVKAAHHTIATKDTDRDKERGEMKKPSGLDEYWLKTSAQGDVFGIQSGKLALSKSTNQAVRTLAQTLVTDHSKSLDDAKKLAAKYDITLEPTPTPTQQWELQQVSTLSGTAFDQGWSSLEGGGPSTGHLRDR